MDFLASDLNLSLDARANTVKPGPTDLSINAGRANRSANAPAQAGRWWPRTSPSRRLAGRPPPRPPRPAQVAAQYPAPAAISRTRTQPRFTLFPARPMPCRGRSLQSAGRIGGRPATDWSRSVAPPPNVGAAKGGCGSLHGNAGYPDATPHAVRQSACPKPARASSPGGLACATTPDQFTRRARCPRSPPSAAVRARRCCRASSG